MVVLHTQRFYLNSYANRNAEGNLGVIATEQHNISHSCKCVCVCGLCACIVEKIKKRAFVLIVIVIPANHG